MELGILGVSKLFNRNKKETARVIPEITVNEMNDDNKIGTSKWKKMKSFFSRSKCEPVVEGVSGLYSSTPNDLSRMEANSNANANSRKRFSVWNRFKKFFNNDGIYDDDELSMSWDLLNYRQ